MTARFRSKNIADVTLGVVVVIALIAPLQAQTPAVPGKASPAPAASPLPVPPGYVIGPDDVLTVFYWRDKEMTTDAVVRPDGKIGRASCRERVFRVV